jgi:hypothetical protein
VLKDEESEGKVLVFGGCRKFMRTSSVYMMTFLHREHEWLHEDWCSTEYDGEEQIGKVDQGTVRLESGKLLFMARYSESLFTINLDAKMIASSQL